MSAYMHPDTARALLSMSRGYWQLRRCGFNRQQAWEIAALDSGIGAAALDGTY